MDAGFFRTSESPRTLRWFVWLQDHSELDDEFEYLFEQIRPDDSDLLRSSFGTAFGGLGELVSGLWLAEGVDVNASNKTALGTALVAAAYSGEKEIVSLLLERGADINIVGGEYGTALGAAAYSGEKEVVSLKLLERGADIKYFRETQHVQKVAARIDNMGKTPEDIVADYLKCIWDSLMEHLKRKKG